MTSRMSRLRPKRTTSQATTGRDDEARQDIGEVVRSDQEPTDADQRRHGQEDASDPSVNEIDAPGDAERAACMVAWK